MNRKTRPPYNEEKYGDLTCPTCSGSMNIDDQGTVSCPNCVADFGEEGPRSRYDIIKGQTKPKLKMYILVKTTPEDLPVGIAMVSVAHASLAAYLKF